MADVSFLEAKVRKIFFFPIRIRLKITVSEYPKVLDDTTRSLRSFKLLAVASTDPYTNVGTRSTVPSTR